MSTSEKAKTVIRPRSLADDLRQRSDNQLEVLFATRPDLLHPVPTDLGQLAVRATTSPSVSTALDALNHIELSVCEVLAALADPASRIEVHAGLKGAVGYNETAIDSAIDRLLSSALVWGDDEELHLVRVARESFGAYPCGLAASFADSRRKVREYASKKNLAEKTIQQFKSKYKNKIIIIRPRLIWGGKNSVASKKLNSALKKKIFFYVDHGQYLTSSTHIYNLYNGINKAIKYGKNKGKYFILDKYPTRFDLLMNAISGKKIQVFSINRFLIYLLCISGDLISWASFGKIRLILSRSLYYLTFSEVIIDDSYTKELLHFSPLSLEQLIREH